MTSATPSEIRGDGLLVPLGRRVSVPGRGEMFVRESGDPEAAVTVLLIHGWFASAGLNWAPVFEPLGEHFRVIAADLRGHGRGIRSRRRFSLEDCADDLAGLIDELGRGPVIVVGYSMGGLVAQLMWHRRPDVVAGLVLCSTTRRFVPGRRERYIFSTLLGYSASTVRASRVVTRWYRAAGAVPSMVRGSGPHPRAASMKRWAAAEMRRHDVRHILEAGHATCHFDSREWISGVDVPTAAVVTTSDRAVNADAQVALAKEVEGATVYSYDEDHTAFRQPAFAPVVVQACRDVAARLN